MRMYDEPGMDAPKAKGKRGPYKPRAGKAPANEIIQAKPKRAYNRKPKVVGVFEEAISVPGLPASVAGASPVSVPKGRKKAVAVVAPAKRGRKPGAKTIAKREEARLAELKKARSAKMALVRSARKPAKVRMSSADMMADDASRGVPTASLRRLQALDRKEAREDLRAEKGILRSVQILDKRDAIKKVGNKLSELRSVKRNLMGEMRRVRDELRKVTAEVKAEFNLKKQIRKAKKEDVESLAEEHHLF